MDNIFLELREVTGDKYHFRVEVSSIEFNVVISLEMFEDFEITISYGFEEFSYVSFHALHKYLKENNETLESLDYGYDKDDIEVIHNVMTWMDKNKDNIIKYMSYCDK